MQKSTFIISIIGTIVMIYIMAVTGKDLKTIDTPNGIIDLEFANTSLKAQRIVNAWKGDLIITAQVNTYWDFLFLFFYSFLLYNICKWIHLKLFFKQVGNWANLFANLSIITALLDLIENILMLKVLSNHYQDYQLIVMSTVSYSKWILVAVIILFCLLGFTLIIFKKKENKS